MSPASAVPAEPGLLARFRSAGGTMVWRTVGRPRAGRRVRIAHLNDEEARVEEWTHARSVRLVTDSGPVGALVVLLEVDRRGPPTALTSHSAGALPKFGQGALEALWGDGVAGTTPVPLADLVGLARYALA